MRVAGTEDTVNTIAADARADCPAAENDSCDAPALCTCPFSEKDTNATSGKVEPCTGATVAEYCA